jgi:hypothetical protein
MGEITNVQLPNSKQMTATKYQGSDFGLGVSLVFGLLEF